MAIILTTLRDFSSEPYSSSPHFSRIFQFGVIFSGSMCLKVRFGEKGALSVE